MNRTLTILSLICGTTLLFSACAYKPQLTSIPLMERKGDLQIDATISPPTLSFSGAASYAFTDHIAAQVFGDISLSTMYGEGAVGFFNRFRNRIVIESYIGLGGGDFNYSADTKPPRGYRGNYYTGFAQFNIGKKNKRFDYGGGIRMGYVFHDISKIEPDVNGYDVISYYSINSTVIEPNLFMRIGGEYIKFSIQGNYCFLYPWNDRHVKDVTNVLQDCPFNLGVGVSFRIPTK